MPVRSDVGGSAQGLISYEDDIGVHLVPIDNKDEQQAMAIDYEPEMTGAASHSALDLDDGLALNSDDVELLNVDKVHTIVWPSIVKYL